MWTEKKSHNNYEEERKELQGGYSNITNQH